MIASVPEGDDKPLKYPLMFHEADLILLNKIDLIPYLKFDTNVFLKAVKGLNPRAEVLQVSCATGEGIDGWISWVLRALEVRRG